MSMKGSKTEKGLQLAFAGESQANRKYLAFASQAELEGYVQVARLFRAAAAAETIHAHAHLKVMGGIAKTAENLMEAISGETHEFTDLYPKLIQDATNEGFDAALRSFTMANTVEKVHAKLFERALAELGNNPEVDYYVCKVCGHTIEGAPTGPCEICGAAQRAFEKIE